MKKHLLLLYMVCATSLLWGQPVTITTIDDLIALSTNNAAKSGYVGQTIELNNDLTITKPWRPIGTAAQPFQGTFKGNGHVISGLGAISGTDGVGLFGYVGATGTIQEVGIGTGHIKTMKNDVCQYIGALVGHNAGTVVRCWNMATIEANGTNVGGLVGQNEGKIEDCYNAGPILKANDLIGGLVGTNTGTINRCYNIGFVRNGYGFVEENTGTITKGYYDRQLYIQNPDDNHKDAPGVTAAEKTKEMFGIFAGNATWVTSSENYPMLAVFANHDAAKVSVASLDLDVSTAQKTTENHMNALVDSFRVNLANSVTWSVDVPEQSNWVFPVPLENDLWAVLSPCRSTEVMMTVKLNGHIREVYAFPVPLPDFYAGKMDADPQTVCLGETLDFSDLSYNDNIDPTGGKPNYRVQLVLTWNESDQSKDSTLINATSLDEYLNTFGTFTWTPNKPGTYTIIRRAADSLCHTEFIPSEGSIPVLVPDTVKPGEIEYTGEDTLCYSGGTIQINNKEEAKSEGSTIHYLWRIGSNKLSNEMGSSLTYTLTQAGTYTFNRYAYNDDCGSEDDAKPAKGKVTITVLEEFKAGEITGTKEFSICDPADIISIVGTINATAATGGDNKIGYQWYMIAGSTTTPIEGATEQNLTLSKVEDKLSFEFDKTYSFFRMVNDTMCQTTPISSKDTVVVTVYPEFTPGDITKIPTYSICFEKEHKVNIPNATPAGYGTQPHYYYWTVNGDTINNATNSSLEYTLPKPGKYIFKRYAYTENCGTKAAATVDTIILLAPFDPGTINNGDTSTIIACSVEDALDQVGIIQGTKATGGDETYVYQWSMNLNGATNALNRENGHPEGESKDLDLSKLGLQAGNEYVFTRYVFDEQCVQQSDYCWSKGQVTLIIYSDVTPGQINNQTIDKTCLQRSKTDKIEVSIASVAPAHAEKGDIVYQWYLEMDGQTTLLESNETLAYTIHLPQTMHGVTTYTFYRKAHNRDCSDEVQAIGKTVVNVSYAEEIQQTIDLCESQFNNGKYVYSYPNKEEARITHTFTQDNLAPWTFNDPVEADCQPRITITPNFLPSPKIKTDNVAEVCQDGEDGTLSLYFQMTAGSANMYSIELSDGLKPYFENQSYITGTMPLVSAGEPGVITLQCKRIGFLGGEKIMYLQVGMSSEEEGQSSCFSTASQITLNVTQGGYIYTKYDKVLYIDNNPKKETDPKFIGYQWYKNGLPVEGATGQYYDEEGAILMGSYFADLTYLENGREAVLRTCTLQMPVESQSRRAAQAPNADKRLEQGRIIIHRGDNQYDIFGTKLGNE